MEATTIISPVEHLTAEEGGAFGAALLAAVGIGAWPDVETACAATVHVAETIQPLHADAMSAAYTRFQKIYPALKQLN